MTKISIEINSNLHFPKFYMVKLLKSSHNIKDVEHLPHKYLSESTSFYFKIKIVLKTKVFFCLPKCFYGLLTIIIHWHWSQLTVKLLVNKGDVNVFKNYLKTAQLEFCVYKILYLIVLKFLFKIVVFSLYYISNIKWTLFFVVICPTLFVSNGEVSYNRKVVAFRRGFWSARFGYPVGTVASFSCDSGYSLSRSSTRTCVVLEVGHHNLHDAIKVMKINISGKVLG